MNNKTLYKPYGELHHDEPEANPPNPGEMHYSTDAVRNFTGKEVDRNSSYDTGLYYYGARYYDPQLGMFIQPDPMEQFPSPYLYTGGNPVNMTDPTGMCSTHTQASDMFGGVEPCKEWTEKTDPHVPLDTGGGGDTTVENPDVTTKVAVVQTTYTGPFANVLGILNKLEEEVTEGFTVQIGIGTAGGAGIGGTHTYGVVVGFSGKSGFQAGFYENVGGGAYGGASYGVTGEILFSTLGNIKSLEGTATTIQKQAGPPSVGEPTFQGGYEGNFMKGGGSSHGITVDFQIGPTFIETHGFITRTKIY